MSPGPDEPLDDDGKTNPGASADGADGQEIAARSDESEHGLPDGHERNAPLPGETTGPFEKLIPDEKLEGRRVIFIISDATGETAEKVVRAALLQFDAPVELRMYTRVRLEDEMRRIVSRAHERHALVVFTVVSHAHREALRRLCDEAGVETVDLIGTLMGKLSQFLGARPIGVPGLLHTISDEYFRRIEAVEFTVKNDDGREPRHLPKADLVLVGISRTSKTPLSTFLAQKGLKVSNVPLVLGIAPPEELLQVDDEKVFCLTIKLDELLRIRQARLRHLGMPDGTSYGQREHVAQEIAYARDIFRQHPSWPVIDITGKAIEETAADILRIMKDHRARRGAPDDF